MARRRRFCGAATVALAVLGLGATRGVSAQTFTITEIAAPSGTHTVAKGLNDIGTVVGFSYTTAPNTNVYTSVSGWRWSGGTLTYLVDPNSNILSGINNSNEAVGFDFTINGASFDSPLGFVDLPAPNHGLPSGRTYFGLGSDSAGYGINDSGQAVGEALDVNGYAHAILYIPPTFSGPIGGYATAGTKDLGTFGGATSAAYGINSLNQIVGGATGIKGDFKAFLWNPSVMTPYSAGMNNLGAFSTNADSIALGISENGNAAGYSFTGSGNNNQRGILYDHGTKVQAGPLSGGTSSGFNGVNSFGLMVGASTSSNNSTNTTRAFLFTNGKRYDLNNLVSNGAGWNLQEATAISETGVIVGYGIKTQLDLTVPTRGFVLTPNYVLQPLTNVPTDMNGGTSNSGSTANINNVVQIDVTVNLSSDNPGLHVPASVVIPAGSSSATFTLTTDPGASGVGNITATLNGASYSAAVNLHPSVAIHVTNLTVLPNPVLGGNNVTATVTLDNPSVGTTSVPLSKIGFPNGGLPAVMPSVNVTNGHTTGSLVFATNAVVTSSSGTVRATYNGTADAPLTINPLQVASVTIKSPVVGGDNVTVKVQLTGKPGAGGLDVALSYTGYGNPGDPIGGSPPSTLHFNQNQTSASFTLTTNVVTTQKNASVTAQYNATPAVTNNFLVNPIGVSDLAVGPNPASLGAGTASAIVTIERPAPTGGWTVHLTSSNAAKADFAAGPTSQAAIDIVIPAGATSSAAQTIYLNATGTVTIKAEAPPSPAVGGKSKQVSLKINP